MGKNRLHQERREFCKPWRQLESLEPRIVLDGAELMVFAGDFDGDGIDTLGFYDPVTSDFRLTNSNSAGVAEQIVHFGPRNSTFKPIVGDFDGDGVDTIGLFDPFAARFYLKNSLDPGTVDEIFRFGPLDRDWTPVTVDFDGDGQDGVALYDRATTRFYVNNTFVSYSIDEVHKFGKRGADWFPLTGDWDGDGDDGAGVYNPDVPVFYFQHTPDSGTVDETVHFGVASSDVFPLVGDWNGDGTATVGVYNFATSMASFSDEAFAGNTTTLAESQMEFFAAAFVGGGVPPTTLTSQDLLIASAPLDKKTLTATDVEQLLSRAAAASASEDAIIAITDRQGRILGVRAEQDVLDTITDGETLVFAIDGAVAKARTAAFFANNTAPLSSRLIRFISQSTITQREVEANPNRCNPALGSFDETVCGPGFVAPIGLGGHFPPEVPHTPVVDLFAIEHTNRDSIRHPGADAVRGTADDPPPLPSRFNVPLAYIPAGQEVAAPESYGLVSGMMPNAQARGIATLPGGLAIYKDIDLDGIPDVLVGGIGVFFPGPDGFATHEQGFLPGIGQSEKDRTNSARTLEAEWIALAAVGGAVDDPIGTVNGVDPVPWIRLRATRNSRLTLVGIELEIIGPHPDGRRFFQPGIDTIFRVGASVLGNAPNAKDSGTDLPVNMGGDLAIAGELVPEGWLVMPRNSPDPGSNITAADVHQIIANAVAEANRVRAAIRLQPDLAFGARTRMVMAVADKEGNVLGLFRMPDATYFSIDVAVAKARNTAYYADPTALQLADQVPGVPAGVAFSNRTFRFLAEPRFPDGVEFSNPAPFSILTDPGTNRAPTTVAGGGENIGTPVSSNVFKDRNATSVLGFDAFNPGTNFRDTGNILNQNGIVFFPGSTPLYGGANELVGGFGVSGDGVDQDDVVTFFGAQGFFPSAPLLRADQVFVQGVRLPFIKFLRNPRG